MDPNKSEDTCDIFGCYLAKGDGTVTVTINDEQKTLGLCDRHHKFVLGTDPMHYSIGETYRNEVEIRPIAAQPLPPVAPEE